MFTEECEASGHVSVPQHIEAVTNAYPGLQTWAVLTKSQTGLRVMIYDLRVSREHLVYIFEIARFQVGDVLMQDNLQDYVLPTFNGEEFYHALETGELPPGWKTMAVPG